MEYQERVPRMKRMRTVIRRNNIYQWVNSFLKAGIAENLDDFPQLEFFCAKAMNESMGTVYNLTIQHAY